MIPAHALRNERTTWTLAAIGVAIAHGAAIGAILLTKGQAPDLIAEPVMVVELPPPGPALAASSPAVTEIARAEPIEPMVQPQAPQVPAMVAVPQVSVPVAREAVRIPTPSQPSASSIVPPRLAVATAQSAPAAVVAQKEQGTGDGPGGDPRAAKKTADYYSLLMAHLQRKKRYPAEARQARQQGVVTVRFTVDRGGTVTASSIKRSSGHDLLDQATLDLMQRVSPLPAIPREMQRDSLTIALPIDYSLTSK